MEEALYVLGKNILGKNVTDRLFPVAKTLAKGMGHIGAVHVLLYRIYSDFIQILSYILFTS